MTRLELPVLPGNAVTVIVSDFCHVTGWEEALERGELVRCFVEVHKLGKFETTAQAIDACKRAADAAAAGPWEGPGAMVHDSNAGDAGGFGPTVGERLERAAEDADRAVRMVRELGDTVDALRAEAAQSDRALSARIEVLDTRTHGDRTDAFDAIRELAHRIDALERTLEGKVDAGLGSLAEGLDDLEKRLEENVELEDQLEIATAGERSADREVQRLQGENKALIAALAKTTDATSDECRRLRGRVEAEADKAKRLELENEALFAANAALTRAADPGSAAADSAPADYFDEIVRIRHENADLRERLGALRATQATLIATNEALGKEIDRANASADANPAARGTGEP